MVTMKRIRKIHISILLFITVMFLYCSRNPSKPDTSEPRLLLKIVEKNISASVGETITQKVNIEGVEDLFGSAIELKYDENILLPLSVDQGQLFSGDSTIFFSDIDESVENRKNGIISFAITRIRGTKAVNGSGCLSHITFKVSTAGTTVVMFNTIMLIKSDGEDIDGLNKIEVQESYIIATTE